MTQFIVKTLKNNRGKTMINCRMNETKLENLSKRINFDEEIPQYLKLSVKQRND
jgi:hypothetical protein